MHPLLGNDAAKQLALRAHQTRCYHHAYLILGEEGMGKKTFATWFAQGMLCRGETHPCGTCSACRKMAHQAHPDFSVVLPPEGKELLPIEVVREVRRSCTIKSNEGHYRIYLIPEIQRFTIGAMAAFLKTLEEPPADVIFLVTAPSAQGLPDTIVSRLMPVRLSPLADQMIGDALTERLPALTQKPEAHALAVSLSGGVLGQALRLAEAELSAAKGGENPHLHRASTWIVAAKQGDGYALLRACVPYEKDKAGLPLWLDALLALLRQELRQTVLKGKTRGTVPYSKWIATIQETQDRLRENANRVLLLQDLCRRVMSR